MNRTALAASLLATTLGLSACSGIGDYTALTLTPEGDTFIAEGVVDGTTPDIMRNALQTHPEIKTVVLQYVPGSADDEANLEAARMLRANGMNTVVPSGGLVASGGTDLFLAGVTREIGPGACLGVHSWAAGGITGFTEGKDVPKDDPQHQLYLSYYDEMGIPQDFYWYTLDAADAENIHYMSNRELTQFGMATTPISSTAEATAASCEAVAAKYEFS
ncbi:alpha/beta hydrolase [Aliiroseovarius marinus]|uniref:COG3904 family protein n=1 Tax=Aliiroseovarius marinus TaxID=2500159 RepID=UPI003D7DB51C